jgi:hypothetical protein
MKKQVDRITEVEATVRNNLSAEIIHNQNTNGAEFQKLQVIMKTIMRPRKEASCNCHQGLSLHHP